MHILDICNSKTIKGGILYCMWIRATYTVRAVQKGKGDEYDHHLSCLLVSSTLIDTTTQDDH